MSTLESIIHAVIAAISSGVILLVAMNFFQSRPRKKISDSPASFFELSDLISTANLRGLALFFSAPFALLFFVIAMVSSNFVDLGREFLITDILSLVPEALRSVLQSLLEATPRYLSPLFVLVGALALFAPYIRAPFEWFKNLVIAATGIDARADDASLRAAEAALASNSADAIESSLEGRFGGRAPLPEELAHASDKTRIAYQVLYFSREDTRLNGLGTSINGTLGALALNKLSIATIRLSLGRVTAALVFYVALCLIWVFIAPLAAPSLEQSLIAKFIVPFEWPLPKYRRELALALSEHTLSFIIPLAFGIYMYPARRAQLGGVETPFQTFAVVFSIQLIASIVVNFVYDLIAILLRESGEFTGVLLSLGDVKIWADVFIPAFAPGLALAIWILCRDWKVRWLTYAVVCVAGAVSLSVCQLTYECISGTPRGYYVHELMLGAFLTLAYFFAGSIARDAFARPGPGARQAAQSTSP
jgi:hypothetical protein